MFDFDIIAIAAKALGAADDAVGGRIDRGAARRRNVDAVVARDPAGDGVDAHAIGRRKRHLVDRAARRDRNADRSGQAGVEALPRLKDRAGFAVFGRRGNASVEAVVIGFVGSDNAGIGAGVCSVDSRCGQSETCCCAKKCDLVQLLRQKSVSQNNDPAFAMSPKPGNRPWRRFFLVWMIAHPPRKPVCCSNPYEAITA